METAEPTADDTLEVMERLVPPMERGQRLFRGALIMALLLHAAFFVEVGRSVPRTIGDRTGSPDAIAVDLVTEADLRSRETVAMPPAGAPAPTPPVPQEEAQKPAEAEPPTPEPQPKMPEPQKAEPAQEAAKAEVQAPAKSEAEAKSEKPKALPDFESSLPDLATLPQPEEEDAKPEEAEPQEVKPEEAKPQDAKPREAEPAKPTPAREPAPPKKKPQQQARLDPQPPDMQSAPPGRSASATRPPGITRSGENDEFGRGVVRALRQTMPPPRGIFGRVTVRLILNENGDLAEVQVLKASGTPLDQNVVFATKQTYFPLPPYKSTTADRTFVITYVYR